MVQVATRHPPLQGFLWIGGASWMLTYTCYPSIVLHRTRYIRIFVTKKVQRRTLASGTYCIQRNAPAPIRVTGVAAYALLFPYEPSPSPPRSRHALCSAESVGQ